jgi:hypothetical protein
MQTSELYRSILVISFHHVYSPGIKKQQNRCKTEHMHAFYPTKCSLRVLLFLS